MEFTMYENEMRILFKSRLGKCIIIASHEYNTVCFLLLPSIREDVGREIKFI